MIRCPARALDGYATLNCRISLIGHHMQGIKAVLLAGGYGTRLSEATQNIPKPMVEIGGRPILWHIMRHYAHFGCEEFLIALGYRGEIIKRYFLDYARLNGNMSVNLADGQVQTETPHIEPWLIHLNDTGIDTSTGGRVKALQPHIHHETFMVTYGDGVSDINLDDLLTFHRDHGRLATLTAVRPPARFGAMTLDGSSVVTFTEKPQIGEGWVNGGFLVFEPGIFDYLKNSNASLESDVLERLAREGQLAAYRHEGFWQCMDTLRDVRLLESLWQSGSPPWVLWE